LAIWLRACTRRGEACAHVIDVGFDGKKQLRMLHRNAEIVDLLIYALKIGFERQNLRGRNVLLQARFDSPQPAVDGAKAIFDEPPV
jgi:hypothetical protein